jgi:hypothetical protein
MLFMDYERNSKEYNEWKARVNVRDNFTCQECGKPGNQAHHIKPWKENPKLRFDTDNGKTLCMDCHNKIKSGGRPKIKDGKVVSFYLKTSNIERLRDYSHKIKKSMSEAIDHMIENAKA